MTYKNKNLVFKMEPLKEIVFHILILKHKFQKENSKY